MSEDRTHTVGVTPKYKIGDIVYYVNTTTTGASHDCPDCFGARTWPVVSPAGVAMEMDCPRCTRGGGYNDNLSLNYTKHVPYVSRLTVGSIQTNTADTNGDFVKYMCEETGVGSGSVYSESKLLPTEEAADAAAAVRCAELQAEASAAPRALLTAEHARMGYFDSLRTAIKENVREEILARVKSEIEDGIAIGAHTPGEWVANVSTDDAGVVHIGIVAITDPSSYHHLNVCDGYGGLSDGFATAEQAPANALLISKAPRLLGMLQALRDAGHDEWQAMRDDVDALIASATGVA